VDFEMRVELLIVAASPAQTVVQEELVKLYGLPLWAAALLVIVATAIGSILARLLWAWLVKLRERYWYGGWVLKVSGGKSGRAWHVPLESEIIKQYKTGKYFAFKQSLGVALMGDGYVDFTFGVDQTKKVQAAPPQATGLLIDEKARVIQMSYPAKQTNRSPVDFAADSNTYSSPEASGAPKDK